MVNNSSYENIFDRDKEKNTAKQADGNTPPIPAQGNAPFPGNNLMNDPKEFEEIINTYNGNFDDLAMISKTKTDKKLYKYTEHEIFLNTERECFGLIKRKIYRSAQNVNAGYEDNKPDLIYKDAFLSDIYECEEISRGLLFPRGIINFTDYFGNKIYFFYVQIYTKYNATDDTENSLISTNKANFWNVPMQYLTTQTDLFYETAKQYGVHFFTKKYAALAAAHLINLTKNMEPRLFGKEQASTGSTIIFSTSVGSFPLWASQTKTIYDSSRI